MSVLGFFSMLFENIVSFLSYQIPLGDNFSISLLSVFIGLAVSGLVTSVLKRLFD